MRFPVVALLIATSVLPVEGRTIEYDLVIDANEMDVTGEPVVGLTVNGGIPGPLLEFTEGDVARIHVKNDLDTWSSIHWHGLLLPEPEDGVPYVTFPGIAPGETFTYEFPIRQSGTYWYHSHSGFQEQRGVYGPIVIRPKTAEEPEADREQVLVLSDWTNEKPKDVMALLKSGNEWYSIRRKANQSLLGAIWRHKLGSFLAREWQSMPDNEISDVAYDRFLMNGATAPNFDADPGDTVRVRIIDGSAATYFYVTSGCGPMTIVAADGLPVEPVEVERLLISIAETYDVLVKVPEDGACELRATAQDGSGHVAGILGRGDVRAAPTIPFPDYYENTMNAGYLRAQWNTAWDVGGGVETFPPEEAEAIQGKPHAHHGMGHGAMKMGPPAQPGRPPNPYAKLRAPEDTTIPDPRPLRVVKLKLTGDMDRYVWSMNGETIAPDNTIRIKKGERVRFEMTNRTMMNHPMHLHGHFFRVLNGQGAHAPLKHTVNVAPMETTVIEFDANEEKDWFFHCHVLYHMHGGMERVVHYDGTEVDAATLAVRPKLYEDDWYAFGSTSILSQMNDGEAQISNTSNIVGAEWEVGYDDGEYDVTGTYSRYINRYLSPFAGVNAYNEDDIGSDVRGVFGLSYLLPLNARTAVWVGTDASFRWGIEKELNITRRLVMAVDIEYDTVTDWEYIAGAEYILTRHLSLAGQYSSEFGWGGGLRVRLYGP